MKDNNEPLIKQKTRKATLAPFLFINSAIALSFIGFLFLPYFQSVNQSTGQILSTVYGIEIALGNARISPSVFMIISELCGAVGALLSLLFAFLFLFSKKTRPFLFLLLAISIMLMAVGLAGIFFSAPIFNSNNGSHFGVIALTWEYYLSASLTCLSILVNAFFLVYIAVQKNANLLA